MDIAAIPTSASARSVTWARRAISNVHRIALGSCAQVSASAVTLSGKLEVGKS